MKPVDTELFQIRKTPKKEASRKMTTLKWIL